MSTFKDQVVSFFHNRKAVISFVAVCGFTYIYFVGMASNETAQFDTVNSKDTYLKKTTSTPAPTRAGVPDAIAPDLTALPPTVAPAGVKIWIATRAPIISTVTEPEEQPLLTDADSLEPDTPNIPDTQPSSSGTITADRLSLDDLVKNYKIARLTMIERIKADYGIDNYHNIFEQEVDGVSINRGRLVFVSKENGSWDRFKNRVVIKIIDVLLSKPNVTFVWATGGHSSTAGHGNFFDESYTAVLERSIKDVFEAVGIQFTGRNYAAGGTDSGPEAAWCVESIFGARDLDIVVWDHGMTDGGATFKLAHYCYRAGLSQNKPACIANHIGGGYMGNSRREALVEFEERGLVAFSADEDVLQAAQNGIPDSAGKTEDEINQLPRFVQNYKCGNLIEAGDPFCGPQKFNLTMCEKRKYMTSWHQGWRWHALQGNLAAFFLMEILGDALKTLETTTVDLSELRQQLQSEIDVNYEKLKDAQLPQSAEKFMENRSDINLDDIYKTPNFCHTARLPAEIRHKGILTGSAPGDAFHFQDGVSEQEAQNTPDDSEFMRLVRDDGSRQQCNATLNIDHKDYFFVTDKDGWKKLVLPNDAELAEYGRGQQLRGLVALCFKVCDWGHCPPGNLKPPDFATGAAEMEINGQAVVGFTEVGLCHFLRGDQGHYWPPSADARFEIRARVLTEKSALRFGAFIVW